MTNFQEQFYDRAVDYRDGSPHLSHVKLRERLVDTLTTAFNQTVASGLLPEVLEVGAGHGSYTEVLLAVGAHVTAVEMSEHAVERLKERFRHNPNLRTLYEPSGSVPSGESFSLVACISVLHHVPDYLTFIDELVDRTSDGGTIVTLQDPLWYPRRRSTHRLDRFAYLLWRLTRGEFRQGFASQIRRLRKITDESNPRDMVEYHVVRQGLDEDELHARLALHFSDVRVMPYWSHQSRLAQRLGERLGLHNTFGLIATGRRPMAQR
jgi:SAM-dependent methyltransferase